jgi:hypothetical protein
MAVSVPDSYRSTLDKLKAEAGKAWDARKETFTAFYYGAPAATQARLAFEEGYVAASSRGPESEAVKLLRRCHDAGDLVTPLDENLREDVAAFFRSRATHSEGEKP